MECVSSNFLNYPAPTIFVIGFSASAAPVIAIIAIGFVIYIFGASLRIWTGPYDAFSWWTPETTELMIVLMVFGIIVWFITKDPTAATPNPLKPIWDAIKSGFSKT